MVQVSYNAQHKLPWHWPVPAYLVTKGIAAGLAMVLALALALGFEIHGPTAVAGAGLSVVFLGLTTVLLVADLEQPMRFLYILRRPQWGSWLARGAVVLISASVLTTLWLGLELGSLLGWLDQALVGALRSPLMAVTALAGAATAMASRRP